MRSAVSDSTRAISLFSKRGSLIQLYRVALRPLPQCAHHNSVRLDAFAIPLLLVTGAPAQNEPITIVSAASYRTVIAPGSIASIFGKGFAASSQVEIGGQAA